LVGQGQRGVYVRGLETCPGGFTLGLAGTNGPLSGLSHGSQFSTLKPMQPALKALVDFRDARDWGQFHDPKNLALALSIEAAELNELYLWKDPEEVAQVDMERIREELADVFAYALLLADRYGLDPEEIVLAKVKQNGEKYPVEKSRGLATKYNEL
jgi:NTP pyrophosphatase (non-canonical NTP hydrolase)